MQPLLIYILKVIIISAVLMLYYYFGLRNKRFHYYNRFYLLLTALLSIVLPLLHLQWFSFNSKSTATINIYKIIYSGSGEDFIVKATNSFNWQQLLLLLFISTCAIMLTHLLFSIIKIYRVKKLYPVNKFLDFDFVHTDLQSAPFSFLKNIFWRNDIKLDEPCGQQILQHEITHIKQRHSVDKIFIQLILCIYWLNPFFWLLKKELYLIHEFIADEKAISNNDTSSFAQMLLKSSFGRFEFAPAQSIFYSSIKRRLTMLTTTKKTQFSYLRRIMVLPLTAAVICLFAFTIKNANTSFKKIVASKPFVLVVDAGHGGKDDGAVSNDMFEKDITLKISEQIKKLSSEYGISVITTRNNDIFMTPAEKSNFANSQNADAFISIHVNAADENHLTNSGIEVVLSKRNKNILSGSEVLGSAIIQNLQNNFVVTPALLQRNIGIWILDQSKVPSALIECGYITNKNDVKSLKDDSKIELMARNILQGVAMYANNKVDKSSLYQLQNTDTSVPQKSSAMQTSGTPLYVLDGKIVSKTIADKKDPSEIDNINVLKGKDATDKYGDKGKNGVIEITLKGSKRKNPLPPPPPPSVPPPPPLRDTLSTPQSTSFVQQTKPIFTKAQIEPQFPGGIDGWRNFLQNNLDASVPVKKNAPSGKYTVTLSFLVDENGKVSDVKAVKDPGYGTAEEATKAIAQGPNWIPAVQNGHKVAFLQKQNITFQVSEVK